MRAKALQLGMLAHFVRPPSTAACRPARRQPSPSGWPGIWRAAGALLCGAAAAGSCNDSTHDICGRAITQQAACDPNMAGAAGPAADAADACSLQLDAESPSCREASRRLSDCIADTDCADIDKVCFGARDGVQFNCNKSPFLGE